MGRENNSNLPTLVSPGGCYMDWGHLEQLAPSPLSCTFPAPLAIIRQLCAMSFSLLKELFSQAPTHGPGMCPSLPVPHPQAGPASSQPPALSEGPGHGAASAASSGPDLHSRRELGESFFFLPSSWQGATLLHPRDPCLRFVISDDFISWGRWNPRPPSPCCCLTAKLCCVSADRPADSRRGWREGGSGPCPPPPLLRGHP